MAVYKKDGKWYFKGKRKLEDGTYKNYNKLAKNAKLQREAKEAERKYLINVDDEVNSIGMSFKDLEDLYLKKMANTIKKTTIQSTEYGYVQLKELENKKIDLLKKESIERVINRLDAEGKSVSYINKIFSVIHKTLDFAVTEKLIDRNPMNDMKKFKRPDELQKEMKFWTYQEFSCFYNSFDEEDYRYKVYFAFLYFMGCRRGEALALNWNDINFSKSTVRIYKTVSQQLKGIHFLITPPKTKHSIRTIQMPSELSEIMKQYKEWCINLYEFNDEFFVFCGDRPFNIKTLNNKLDKYCDKSNIKRIRIHDIRHSHASLLINKGANDKAVADRLGNTVGMTREVYSHLFQETEDELINIINNVTKKNTV